MNVKRILDGGGLALLAGAALCLLATAVWGQEKEAVAPPFREPLYMSELQRNDGFAQAVRVGGVVFVSATTAPGADFEAQLKTIYLRLQSTLGQFGLTMANVAQERIYTLDMAALQSALESRRAYYPADAVPAVSWVEVQGLADPDALLAVELMAVAEPEAEEE